MDDISDKETVCFQRENVSGTIRNILQQIKIYDAKNKECLKNKEYSKIIPGLHERSLKLEDTRDGEIGSKLTYEKFNNI